MKRVLNLARRAVARLTRPRLTADAPVTVTIVGGLGSQIISASAYYYLQRVRPCVFADTSYFDRPVRVAGPGQGCSQWPWALDIYGVARSSFHEAGTLPRDGAAESRGPDSRTHVIDDGVEKLHFALRGLTLPEIREHFRLPPATATGGLCARYGSTKYAFIHIRQGDYLNVASHVVPPSQAAGLLGPLRRLVDKLIVSSDSPLPADFLNSCRSHFPVCDVLIDHDLAETHWLMRQASILVTSNSTLSLTAALLNEGGLVLGPSRWFGHQHGRLEEEVLRHFSWRCLAPMA